MKRDEDIALLDSACIREAIEINIGREPSAIALDKKLPHAALVATQVKYLQRARKKLPSYYGVRAIIPPLAFEQSSSEASASHKNYSGGLCVDLTCGLGVDSFCFSKKFGKVISVERDPALAETARINFARLGADNITVVNLGAEEFIGNFTAKGEKADLIYVDPDRRSGDKKYAALEDCRPDVIALLSALKKAAERIVIKASPLFDVGEAFRIFGDRCRVEAVSLGGECKEVLIELCEDITEPVICAAAIGSGRAEYPFRSRDAGRTNISRHEELMPANCKYMIIPDVSLRKARLVIRHYASVTPGASAASNEGYVFLDKLPARPTNIMGRIYKICETGPYNPKALKRKLNEESVRSADIFIGGFPRNAAQICRELGIREGGSTKLAFTRTSNSLWYIRIEPFDVK